MSSRTAAEPFAELEVQPNGHRPKINGDPYQWAKNIYSTALKEFERVLKGRNELFEVMVVGLAAGGHVLLEGMWGSGKTEGAKAAGEIFGLDFKRIQFTPDLMPQDITGSDMPDEHGLFHFVPGPIFSQLVLGDEINRATPKTLAGLMEGAGEGQVTSNGVTRPLPQPFFVISTRNPYESEGTYTVPEALLDRKLLEYTLPPLRGEGQLKSVVRRAIDGRPKLRQVFSKEDILELTTLRKEVRVSDDIADFIERIVYSFNLEEDKLDYAPAERAAIALAHVGQAVAMLDARADVTEADVLKYAISVLQHRLRLKWAQQGEGWTNRQLIERKLSQFGYDSASA